MTGSIHSNKNKRGMTSQIHSITVGSPYLDDASASMTASTPLLLIHGLDSSSATWKNVMNDLSKLPHNNNNNSNQDRLVIAMDCRGCGYSADIDPSSFSLTNLVQDVHDCLMFHNVINNDVNNTKKVILLGHSMGARIALSFAATYPDCVKCLIMEDMDIARRPIASAPFAIQTTTTATNTAIFDRSFHSQQQARQALLQADYPAERVDAWQQDGRIHYRSDHKNKNNNNNNKRWWSNVNPDFRRLCYQHVVDTDYGERDYNKLVALCADTDKLFQQDAAPCCIVPVHVLVASNDATICSQVSLQQMMQQNKHCKIHRFPLASHSIHSTDRDNFLATIQEILRECD